MEPLSREQREHVHRGICAFRNRVLGPACDAFRRRCCFALVSVASSLGVSVRALTHLNDEANPQHQPQVDVRVACDRHGAPTDAPAVLVIQDLEDVFERHFVELSARSVFADALFQSRRLPSCSMPENC